MFKVLLLAIPKKGGPHRVRPAFIVRNVIFDQALSAMHILDPCNLAGAVAQKALLGF